MKCLECGREVRMINSRHLQSCSGITTKEYANRHPGAEFMDQAVKDGYSRPGSENPNWQGGKTIKECRVCGKRLSRRSTGGVCRKCSQGIHGNPFSGRHHTDETRQRMRQSAALRDRNTYKSVPPDWRKAVAARQDGLSQMSPEERRLHLSKFIQAGQAANKKSSGTKIEVFVARILAAAGVSFRSGAEVAGAFVDFLVGRTVIECYGDYWHCNPSIYAPAYYHKNLHMTAADKWAKDAERIARICAAGYGVLIVWESEIKTNPAHVANLILQAAL